MMAEVSEFPHVREEAVARPTADIAALVEAASDAGHTELPAVEKLGDRVRGAMAAAKDGASFAAIREALNSGEAASARPFEPRRFASGFEELRDASDAYAAKQGGRPKVFLANLGTIPQHKARAMFAQNLVEAGGFEAVSNEGFASAEEAAAAFAESGAQIAVLCSSDDVYAELAVPTAEALGEKGAKAIVLAGKPGDAEDDYEDAGVSHFIFMGCNVQGTLRSLLTKAEVL